MEKNDFFQRILRFREILQKVWENILQKRQTLYFQKLIDLLSYDTCFLKNRKKCNFGSLIFTHHGTKFLFSRPRAFDTYILSTFHGLSILVGFSLRSGQHSQFLLQKTRMLQNMKKTVWNLSLQSLRNFETIIWYICK